jgi:hypothetical protein
MLTTRLNAQETTGAISGSTVDESGALLPGVRVTVKEVKQGRDTQVTTNRSARYTALLPAGEYELKFESPGFSSLTVTGVSVHTKDRLQVNAVLIRGGEAKTREFSLHAQFIQPASEVQSLISDNEFQELPLINRNVVQLGTLVPGVSSDLADEVEILQGFGGGSRVNLAINGARRSAPQWLVDGQSYVETFNNSTLFMTPSLESIRELKVITSGQGAEEPRGGGGSVDVVTKSGTSKISGTFYEFLRNDRLNANSFSRNNSSSAETRAKPSRLRYNNFGYTIGGPVNPVENLFFFFSQEWRRASREHFTDSLPVPDPAWLTDTANANYVAPADRDPNAVKLLDAWPAPNVPGTNLFRYTAADTNDTRQENVRLDYQLRPNWQLTGRYTHDLSEKALLPVFFPQREAGRTDVPTHAVVAQLSTFLDREINELSYRFSVNNISQKDPKNTKTTREGYGIEIPELLPGNRGGLIPSISISSLAFGEVLVPRQDAYRYSNHTIVDNFLLERVKHTIQTGLSVMFEEKDGKFAEGITQGSFTFRNGGGLTAFQNFLRGNRDGQCGTACTYYEEQLDVRNQLRFNTYEAYVQDRWQFLPTLTFNFGLRYLLGTPVQDKDDLLLTFTPQAFDPAKVPTFSNAFGTSTVIGTGDPLNGWIVAGKNSPYRRSIYDWDKNNVQPRVGVAWDPRSTGDMIIRGAYGIFYAPPLVSIFMQNTQGPLPNPLQSRIDISNPSLSNPASGTVTVPTTAPVSTRFATSERFLTPRIQQWNVGMQRRLYRRGVIEIGYVGSKSDHLIRPVDINQPQPQDLLAAGGRANLARPYQGYGSIIMRETTARGRYHGLLTSFRHSGGRTGTLVLNYTLSRNETDATFDNTTSFEPPHFQSELPQNPLDKHAEFAAAQTDRTHIVSAYYVYELPFFRTSAQKVLKQVLGGWQVAGITTASSGPTARIWAGTLRPNQIDDPEAGEQAYPLWITPDAFVSPAPGTYGTAPVAPFRLPGYYQWDISLSKNFNFAEEKRFQVRADFINAFNQTQFRDVNTNCAGTTSCAQFNSAFGALISSRAHAPREIQLSLRLNW